MTRIGKNTFLNILKELSDQIHVLDHLKNQKTDLIEQIMIYKSQYDAHIVDFVNTKTKLKDQLFILTQNFSDSVKINNEELTRISISETISRNDLNSIRTILFKKDGKVSSKAMKSFSPNVEDVLEDIEKLFQKLVFLDDHVSDTDTEYLTSHQQFITYIYDILIQFRNFKHRECLYEFR